MSDRVESRAFFGWRVAAGAAVLAAFGWGCGFYGPPVFLATIAAMRGWPLATVSAAVTLHYLIGAAVSANLPRGYRHFGAGLTTKAAALCLGGGIVAWALCIAPWQLFAAAALSGAGWGAMSAAAVNGIVSPWFVRSRASALALAYNGASIGGVIFSPLWVAAIAALGFAGATGVVAAVMGTTMWVFADRLFAKTPQAMGLAADGKRSNERTGFVGALPPPSLSGRMLWRNRRFLTLAAFMACGLFAQIGLTTHLFSLLTPALGAQRAGVAMAAVTAMAIVGRTLTGWLMPLLGDRRLAACLGYSAQLAGSLAFLCAGGTNVPLLLAGVILFGAGFGNATSLPPLVAQSEFAETDVPRVVALIVGISQAGYAFAPALFGLVRVLGAVGSAAPGVFVAAALAQGLAIAACLLGRAGSPLPASIERSAARQV